MSREDERFSDRPPDDRGDYDRRDDDLDRIRRRPQGGMDGFFLNTNMVLLVIFGFCCGGIAMIVGIIGLCICKDPDAKQRAMVVTIIGAIMAVLNVIATFGQLAGKQALR